LFKKESEPALIEPSAEPNVNDEVVSEVNAEPSDIRSYEVGRLQDFDRAKFENALADGKTVLLDFYAPWCPTCRANEPVLDTFFDGSSDIVGFRVDYDTATILRQKYGVTVQSTYIVVNRMQELNRYTGSLNSSRLSRLLEE